ncbi:hypothetical protein PG985_000786 [Apiospora marii]|uniref:Uncharacterized protein n=1 Tax=Apiospora marii TaxID=335849 RepID=A0ABR1R3U3_9PEZI
MAGFMSMTAPGASAETFRENIQAIVSEAVGNKLKDEDLQRFDKEREEALRQIPENVKAFDWCKEQMQRYEDKCHQYLKDVRPKLHHAIDKLIDSLEKDFVGGSHGQRQETSFRTPQAPRSASNGFPIRLSQLDTFGPSQPRAPEAAMDALSRIGSSPTRSETLLAEDSRPAAPRDRLADHFINPDVGENGIDPGSPVLGTSDPAPPRACADILSAAPGVSSASKRQSGDEAAPEGNNKRRRRSLPNSHDASSASDLCPKKQPITLSQVKPDEKKCKSSRDRNRANDLCYFRAHPFKYNRAMNHFGKKGHNSDQEDTIYQTYACEVSDAIEERNCNLNNPKARQPQTPKTPNSELPGPSDAASERPAAVAPLTPMSPSTSRDKGKQPASVVELDLDDDDDSLFVGQSSGSAAAEELLRSQPYPTRNRVSIPDEEIMEIDEIDEGGHVETNSDSDSSDEDDFEKACPPLDKWFKAPRRFAPS